MELYDNCDYIVSREKYFKVKSIFRIGEEVVVKECRFRVSSIGHFGMMLVLLGSVADQHQ